MPAVPPLAPPAPLPTPDVSNATLVRRMLAIAWMYRWGCVLLLVLQGLLLATALGILALTGLGIDIIRFHAGDAPRLPESWLLVQLPRTTSPLGQVTLVGGAILLLALSRGLLNYWYTVASGWLIHRQIVADLRSQVYDKLQQLSFRFFDANATGSIINRVTGDVQAVRAFVDGVVIQLVLLVLSLAVYLVYMLKIHVGLTAACLASTPLLWWLTVRFSRRVRPQYDQNRELVDAMVLTLTENLQGVHVVKGFHREPEEIAKFHARTDAVRDQQQSIFYSVSLFTPTIGFLTQVNLAVLLAYGGWLVTRDQLPLGTGLVVFAGLLQQFSSQVTNMTNIANSVQQALSGARRVFEILDTHVEIHSPPHAPRVERLRGEVVFENVTFGYDPQVPVLQHINLVVAPGRKIALLGATGAGKSTLLSLLPRFYDPQEGRIFLDGRDIREYHLDDLRRGIGVVFQESFLFSNTVAANIAFGHPQATAEQIERAARIACAHEFIVELPDGYHTILGEAGMDLSGGQRQRLAIARAVLLDPAILLLDDPTAAIDPHTEGEILDAMESAMRGRTTFVVAHRLSTLKTADQIVVLEGGRITQVGVHTELMGLPGHYRDAALMQGVS